MRTEAERMVKSLSMQVHNTRTDLEMARIGKQPTEVLETLRATLSDYEQAQVLWEKIDADRKAARRAAEQMHGRGDADGEEDV